MPNLIVISGEEEFLMERAARDEASLSLSEEVLEFTSDELENYKIEAGSAVIGGQKRTFIIWDAKEIPPLPAMDNDTLVIVGKKPLQHPNAKRALKFPKLKSFSDNNEVIGFILKEGQRHNIDLSRIAGALFVNTGNCLRKLASEIEKLAWAVPQGSVVTPEIARPLLCFSAELTPREIIDSICDGHTTKALAYLDKLQELGDETGWILAYMQRHVLQQLKFELLLERKTPDDRASTTLGVHPFIYRRMLITRRGLWTKPSLLNAVDVLCDLDIAHKRGSATARLGLELEVIRLSEEARDVKR